MSRIYTTLGDLIAQELTLDGVEPNFDTYAFAAALKDAGLIKWESAEDDCGMYDGPHQHLDRQGYYLVTDEEGQIADPGTFWALVERFDTEAMK